MNWKWVRDRDSLWLTDSRPVNRLQWALQLWLSSSMTGRYENLKLHKADFEIRRGYEIISEAENIPGREWNIIYSMTSCRKSKRSNGRLMRSGDSVRLDTIKDCIQAPTRGNLCQKVISFFKTTREFTKLWEILMRQFVLVSCQPLELNDVINESIFEESLIERPTKDWVYFFEFSSRRSIRLCYFRLSHGSTHFSKAAINPPILLFGFFPFDFFGFGDFFFTLPVGASDWPINHSIENSESAKYSLIFMVFVWIQRQREQAARQQSTRIFRRSALVSRAFYRGFPLAAGCNANSFGVSFYGRRLPKQSDSSLSIWISSSPLVWEHQHPRLQTHSPIRLDPPCRFLCSPLISFWAATLYERVLELSNAHSWESMSCVVMIVEIQQVVLSVPIWKHGPSLRNRQWSLQILGRWVHSEFAKLNPITGPRDNQHSKSLNEI